MQTSKQKPHTGMWGTTCFSIFWMDFVQNLLQTRNWEIERERERERESERECGGGQVELCMLRPHQRELPEDDQWPSLQGASQKRHCKT